MTRMGVWLTRACEFYGEPDPVLTDRHWRAVAALMRRNIDTCFTQSRDPERDRTIVRRWLLEDARAADIARDLGMSRQRVYQVKAKGRRMLSHPTRMKPVRLLLRRLIGARPS